MNPRWAENEKKGKPQGQNIKTSKHTRQADSTKWGPMIGHEIVALVREHTSNTYMALWYS